MPIKRRSYLFRTIDWSRLHFGGRRSQPPAWLVIESSSQCTGHCPVCGARYGSRLERGNMKFSTFPELARQAAVLAPRKVALHGRGEPLLHPNICDMVAELARNGLKTQLVTNGDLLTEETARLLLSAGLDELVVSMPSVTPENFRAVRGREIKSDEEHRLISALSAWKNGGGGRAVLRGLILPACIPEQDQDVARYIGRWLASKVVDRLTLTLYQPWPRHVMEEYLTCIHTHSSPCRICLDSLCIFWDGSVGPCSFDVDGELTFAVWPEMSLLEAFNAPAMRRIRRSWLVWRHSRPALCKACLLPRVPTPTAIVPLGKKNAGKSIDAWVEGKARASWKRLTAF